MDAMYVNGSSLVLAALVGVLAPLLCEVPSRFRMPVVVLEVAFGIAVGPHLLRLAEPEGLVAALGYLGLVFLFFLAGMEIDPKAVRGTPLSKATAGWFTSVAIAYAAALALHAAGMIQSPLLTGAALTTTTIGTLLPILRDSGEMRTRFGTYVLATGIVGELGPIVLVSILFTREHKHWAQTALMIVFVVVALAAALVALRTNPPKFGELISRTMEAASQLPVRIAILVLAVLVALAEKFGLDMILGAFAAGMVVGLASRGEQGALLRRKMDAIGFGFLVPMFFITSGMRFDLSALLHDAKALSRVPLFLVLFLLVRGLPALLYRNELAGRNRMALALYSATALPLVIALTELGVATGRMRSDNAAALVGAGLLSVLMFPTLALWLRRSVAVTESAETGVRGG